MCRDGAKVRRKKKYDGIVIQTLSKENKTSSMRSKRVSQYLARQVMVHWAVLMILSFLCWSQSTDGAAVLGRLVHGDFPRAKNSKATRNRADQTTRLRRRKNIFLFGVQTFWAAPRKRKSRSIVLLPPDRAMYRGWVVRRPWAHVDKDWKRIGGCDEY